MANLEPCARCGQRPAAPPGPTCAECAARGPLTPEEAARWRERQAEDRDDWPVHQPECFDAPIPGRQWFSGCEPGGDWDSEIGAYDGIGPRVDPSTGVCVGCGRTACRACGRENCPDHQEEAA